MNDARTIDAQIWWKWLPVSMVLVLIVALAGAEEAFAETMDPKDYGTTEDMRLKDGRGVAGALTEPPFGATHWWDPDIVTPEDATTLVSVEYTGQHERLVFDRRRDRWLTLNVHVFKAEYDDGVQTEFRVNPEYESVEAARPDAERYARILGQLPRGIGAGIEWVGIHKGNAAWGGSRKSITIHTEFKGTMDRPQFQEEVLLHEAGHAVLDERYGMHHEWLAAQQADGGFVSRYGRSRPDREDIAETLGAWMPLRFRSDRISDEDAEAIRSTIPSRIAFFDRELLGIDMYPWTRRISATLPLVLGATHNGRESFVRIRNTGAHDGEVDIIGIDDSGAEHGPVTLAIDGWTTVGLNSADLEAGNTAKGLSDGLGDGTGHWRLELGTSLDIEARGYVRTEDGFVTSMHQTAQVKEGYVNRYTVPFLNPGRNMAQVSWLRISNPNIIKANVAIEGQNSSGRWGERLELTLNARESVLISSRQMEEGNPDVFTGRLGKGAGKWRLEVTGGGLRLEVMSLLATPTGHLSNMSR